MCAYSYTHAYIHMIISIDVEKAFDKFKAILYFKAIYKVGIGKKTSINIQTQGYVSWKS